MPASAKKVRAARRAVARRSRNVGRRRTPSRAVRDTATNSRAAYTPYTSRSGAEISAGHGLGTREEVMWPVSPAAGCDSCELVLFMLMGFPTCEGHHACATP